jgi:hypothetical protein
MYNTKGQMKYIMPCFDQQSNVDTKARTANSSYKKLSVQWFNEALYFVSSSALADGFRHRNRQLLVAANRLTGIRRKVLYICFVK